MLIYITGLRRLSPDSITQRRRGEGRVRQHVPGRRRLRHHHPSQDRRREEVPRRCLLRRHHRARRQRRRLPGKQSTAGRTTFL
jgi:hypothetical protein